MLGDKPILIVEDNCFVALDLACAVEDAGGCVVGPVATVVEALSLLDIHTVAGAVLDCDLIDRNVTPVALSLVERGVPLIIYSGTGLPPELAISHAHLPVLMKPLQPAIVIEILARNIHAKTVKS